MTMVAVRTDRRVEIFGVTTDALTMDETVDAARHLVSIGGPHQHVVLNAAKVVELEHDARLRDVVRGCDLVSADGASVVWASRLLRRPVPERVAGIDLFVRLVEAAYLDGHSVYFLGAREEIVRKVVDVFAAQYPGIRIAGFRNGYWDDSQEVVDAVRTAAPDYLFLAMPSPTKEFWLSEHLAEMAVPFVMGVGGSFDVVAGKVARAPKVVQRAGLEWAWRLGQEPRRMWKRYLVGNLSFIALTLRDWGRAFAEHGDAR